MFKEFPKALYQGGDAAQALVIVGDEAEEAARREEGFRMVGEPELEPPKRPEGEGGDAAQGEPEASPSTETAPPPPAEVPASAATPTTTRKRTTAQNGA